MWETVKTMGLVQQLKTIEQLKRVKQLGLSFVKIIIININNLFRMIYNITIIINYISIVYQLYNLT